MKDGEISQNSFNLRLFYLKMSDKSTIKLGKKSSIKDWVDAIASGKDRKVEELLVVVD